MGTSYKRYGFSGGGGFSTFLEKKVEPKTFIEDLYKSSLIVPCRDGRPRLFLSLFPLSLPVAIIFDDVRYANPFLTGRERYEIFSLPFCKKEENARFMKNYKNLFTK